MTTLRRRAVLIGSTASAFAAPAIVKAQNLAQAGDWPKGPIKIIVPFPPGGSTDPVARIIQAKLVDQTGWQVIVDNKPGGASVVGASIAAKSPPDGQTWMVTFDSHILNPAFAPSIPYKDSELMNVMQIGRTPQTIAAHPDRPYKTFAEVAADAKARPEKVSFGVLGGSQALVLATLINKENDAQDQPDPLQGRRAAGAGPAGRRHRHRHLEPGLVQPAHPRQQDPPDRRHRRGAHARAARHADARRAGHQGLPVLFVVGRLCAGRRAASRSSSACMPRSPRRCARPT